MPESSLWTLVISLALLALGLTYKLAEVRHSLKRTENDFTAARSEITTLNEKHQKQIQDIKMDNETRINELLGKLSEFAAIEKTNIRLKQQATTFESKISILESDNEKLQQEIKRRDDIIQKEKSHNALLDEATINVLKLLFKQNNLTPEQVAQSMNIDVQTAKFHLEKLKTAGMIKEGTLFREVIEKSPAGTLTKRQGFLAWTLEQKGCEYLIKSNIVPRL